MKGHEYDATTAKRCLPANFRMLVCTVFAMLLAMVSHSEEVSANELDLETLSYSAEIEFLAPDHHTKAVYMNGFLDAMVYIRLNGMPSDTLIECLFGHDFTLQNGYIFSDPVAEQANEIFRSGNENFSIAVVAMDVLPGFCENLDTHLGK